MVDWDSMDVDKELTREVFKLTPRVLHVFLKTKILGRVLEILAPCFEAKTRPSVWKAQHYVLKQILALVFSLRAC